MWLLAPENQQHKILWAAVGTRRWLPFLQLHRRENVQPKDDV
jgi:hypothetical protein